MSLYQQDFKSKLKDLLDKKLVEKLTPDGKPTVKLLKLSEAIYESISEALVETLDSYQDKTDTTLDKYKEIKWKEFL